MLVARVAGMTSASMGTPVQRKRILVVEDEVAAGDAIAQALGKRYDVVVARNGLQGLQAALEICPDLIVTDVNMPHLDGVGMVRRIREQTARKVPVIFLTASDAPMAVVEGIQAGARHYLIKPVDLGALELRIARALG